MKNPFQYWFDPDSTKRCRTVVFVLFLSVAGEFAWKSSKHLASSSKYRWLQKASSTQGKTIGKGPSVKILWTTFYQFIKYNYLVGNGHLYNFDILNKLIINNKRAAGHPGISHVSFPTLSNDCIHPQNPATKTQFFFPYFGHLTPLNLTIIMYILDFSQLLMTLPKGTIWVWVGINQPLWSSGFP